MLYVREIMDLMGAYPGRDFKMVEIVNYVTGDRDTDVRKKRAIRKGALRAIEALQSTGCLLVRPPRASRGGYAHYRWRE
jgi:hypothetical protein